MKGVDRCGSRGSGESRLGWKTQDFLVQEMGRRPIRKDVSASGDLPPLSAFKVVPYDFSWSASNKDLFRKKWNNILIGE